MKSRKGRKTSPYFFSSRRRHTRLVRSRGLGNVNKRQITDSVDQPSVGEEPLIKKMRLNDSASSGMQTCIANSVDEPSIIDEPHTKKPRLLERYNTEEAVAKAFGTSNE